ncbi:MULTISPECIES: YozE family protein [Weissella]|uniref:UPF0346 protein FOL01_1201 n=3 Tax=Weissella TaxID=46255 RepID=A0A1L6RC55_9LACO|nr:MULTISPECIES: YozE family protein [Weissella]CCC57195.1 UPF0346 protein HMPREF0877_1279 [Weissella thailandensis fsh4-2]APS42060.1 hypothetical protein FOL01_1201 [Weissella jogaejeotgali]NKY89957.1 YozE family protein [Weissella thailandensis]RDS59708.1 YozE family protein [Weissella thailandensis]GEP74232.1 UPF0346 protein [Weissella thailandensis]
MRRPFFQWLMTQRNPTTADEVENFANAAFYDTQFPKQSDNFDLISRYLEENATYLHSMSIFDQAWSMYQASEE